jgi:hypothetical protein
MERIHRADRRGGVRSVGGGSQQRTGTPFRLQFEFVVFAGGADADAVLAQERDSELVTLSCQ